MLLTLSVMYGPRMREMRSLLVGGRRVVERERERERERGGEFKIVLFSMYTNVILLLRALTACGTVFLMARDLEYATIRARVTI